MLQRYGLERDGRLRAPRLAIRAAYKGRWNMLHDQPLEAGLSRVEKQAFEGWIVLVGDQAIPSGRRKRALEAYEAAGGRDAAEARGVLHFQRREYAQASEHFSALYDSTGVLRFRNYALASSKLAGQTE